MQVVTLARNAMATRFELVLHGNDPAALRAAGEEALDEIDHIEAQLSLYRPGSEIAQANARAATEPVRLTPEVFALLQRAEKISREAGGAFDITIAPLVRCWGFMGRSDSLRLKTRETASLPSREGSRMKGAPPQFPSSEGSGADWSGETGKIPSPEELAAARSRVGMNLVQLDPRDRSVRFARQGVMLDLGAIGKGYAVERAADLLRESGVTSALIHGGTSTACAIGSPPETEFWKVALKIPESARNRAGESEEGVASHAPAEVSRRLTTAATVPLKNQSLSVSAVWGRSFEAEGKTFGHVLDPRTGQPVSGALLAAVVLPSATETDALSTALLTLGLAGFEAISNLRPGMKTLLVVREGSELRVKSRGIDT